MAVWLKARRDFTFKGTPYRSGDVFQETPIVAVQMQAMRAVVFAKAPVAPPVESPATPSRRRRTPTKASTPTVAAAHVDELTADFMKREWEEKYVGTVAAPEVVAVPTASDDDQNADLPHDD